MNVCDLWRSGSPRGISMSVAQAALSVRIAESSRSTASARTANRSSVGRQQNRRVEIIVSGEAIGARISQ